MKIIAKTKKLYKKYKEIINYVIVGGLTTVVSLASYYALVLTVLDPQSAWQLQIANIVSWILSVTFAYFTNRKYVFESKNNNVLKEAGKFYSSRIGTLLLDMAIMFVAVTWFGMNDKIAKILVQVVVLVANYILSKFFVFSKNAKISHMNQIDFVVTWVDGNDPKWLSERKMYERKIKGDNYACNNKHFREWDVFKYWFRAVEKFAPWVHKVYLVTYGHVPKWLNTKNPKLVIVKHSDFMPKGYLPTYNSVALELNLHRINGLSDNFVYFNDDTFLAAPVKETDYFKNGKAKYNLTESAMTKYGVMDRTYRDMLMTTNEYINKNFKKDHFKNLTIKDLRATLRNLQAITYKKYIGFATHHHASAYFKETFDHVWQKEPEICDFTSRCKFRNPEQLTPDILDLWQVGEGKTMHYSEWRHEKYCSLKDMDIKDIKKALNSPKIKRICLNDDCDDKDFVKKQPELVKILDEFLPEKSSYEK